MKNLIPTPSQNAMKKKNLLLSALVVFAMVAAAGSALAANGTWNNTGTDFNNGTNWTPGLPPPADRGIFDGAVVNQPALSANITMSGITFNSTTTSGYLLSSTSGSLTLTSTGIGSTLAAIRANNTSGTNTISAPIILGQAAATGAGFHQIASGTLAITGDISSTNAITGLTLSGSVGSKYTLSGNNTYSGTTTIGGSSVLLNINSATAISSGALVAGATGTIDNSSGSAIILTNNNDINLSAGNLNFTGSNDLSFGSGVATISGNNRQISTTAGTLTIGSIDADTTGRVLTKAGAGTLAITDAAGDNFQGGLTLNAGVLIIGNKTSLGSGNFTHAGSSTLVASTDLSGGNAVANPVFLTGNGPTLTIGGSNNLTLAGNLTVAGNTRTIANTNAGATVLSGNIYLSDISGTGRTLTISGNQSMTISGAIANFNGSGTAGNLTITNTGTVSLTSADSSYTGITTAGVISPSPLVLAVTKLANGGSNSSIGAASSAAANLLLANGSTLRYVGSGDSTDRLFTINGSSTNHNTTIDASGTGAINFTNTGGLAYGSANQTRTLFLTGSNTDNNILAAAIANNGSGNTTFTKNGVGTWVLSGTNTYTGVTTNTNGTLQLAKQVALYNNTPASWTSVNIITQSGATTAFNVGGTGEFTSANIDTIKALGSGSTGFTNGSFIGLDTTNSVNGTFTYGTSIANTNAGANVVGLKKLGTGTLDLTANSTYTGATTVNAGTLLISAGNINSSAVTVAAGAELKYSSSTARTGAITLSGNGSSSRAILSGIGTINVALTLNNIGDTLSPGNSPDTQPFATSQTWNSFTYLWETNNFVGTTAGTDFDQITIAGSLNLTGGLGAYVLDITSLTGGNVAGNVGSFSEVNRSWTILTTTTGITGFSAANWALATANFTSSPAWTGTWELSQSGNNLVLNYAIPEPSTWALLAASLTTVMVLRRRRRK